MIFEMIQNNYGCMIMCLLLVIFVITDKSFNRTINKMFLMAVGNIMLLMLVDNLEIVEASKSVPHIARYVYSAVGYTLRPATAIMVVFIMFRNKFKQINRKIIMGILSIFFINAVFCFVSIGTKWVFGYDANNEFYRGPLGMLPFVTAGLYIVFMVIITVVTIKNRLMEETLVVFTIGALSMIGTLLESIAGLDGTLNISCATGILFYYLYLHVSIYARDPLTNAYNRRVFYMTVERVRGEKFIIVAIDLNYLKKINDEKGHAEGDKALIALGDIVNKNIAMSCDLFRMGGDEFTILCRRMKIEEVENMMKIIEWEMNKTSYSFAYGIAEYNKGKYIDEVTNEADKKMYEMKKRMKAVRIK